MYKECDVVMLSTNQKTNVYINEYTNLGNNANKLVFAKYISYHETNPIKLLIDRGYTPQHLYILSDDEIKEGDWCININNHTLYHLTGGTVTKETYKHWKKIIGTTDTSLLINNRSNSDHPYNLNFPQIPESFINLFVTEYNKSNIITKVNVEYDVFDDQCDTMSCAICNCSKNTENLKYTLKINSDNTINIKSIKDSWNRQEVINILIDLYDNQFDIDEEKKEYINWIKQNI